MVTYKFHRHQVVGKALSMEKDEHPKIYRMKLWATNEVRSRSKLCDWAGSEDDMKSTSGYAFTLGSGIFSWASKKQETVAQSSAEAEYVAASNAANQAIWVKRILEDTGETQGGAVQLFCVNMSAIDITKNSVYHSRTKHIAIKHHFIREASANGEIEVIYCRTEEQIADIFTKALSRPRFEYLRDMLGVARKCIKEEC